MSGLLLGLSDESTGMLGLLLWMRLGVLLGCQVVRPGLTAKRLARSHVFVSSLQKRSESEQHGLVAHPFLPSFVQ
jgi:hypothetical protein